MYKSFVVFVLILVLSSLPKHMRMSAAAMLRMYMLVVVCMCACDTITTRTRTLPAIPTWKSGIYLNILIYFPLPPKIWYILNEPLKFTLLHSTGIKWLWLPQIWGSRGHTIQAGRRDQISKLAPHQGSVTPTWKNRNNLEFILKEWVCHITQNIHQVTSLWTIKITVSWMWVSMVDVTILVDYFRCIVLFILFKLRMWWLSNLSPLCLNIPS